MTTTPENPGGGGSTLTDERTEEQTDYRYDAGDDEKFSHYAPKDKIMQAMIEGTPVRAICGKLWVPSRDPKRFPLCPVCKDLYENVVHNDDKP
ncbi:DUF3039 domain-containing protein [Dactylosporangium sp. NPDC049525]|uniref:DUF3039 domain-containing protein n=1 Tax=Dactylosporangium sp. NPDC049525 TaxID=3154730 RepID=UPI003411F8D9